MRLTDLRLLVEDVERSVRFFRDMVGLAPTLLVSEGVYAEFATPGATLTVYRADHMRRVVGENAAGPQSGDAFVAVLAVDDVDAASATLRDRGIELVTEPHDQEAWGIRVCHFRDPDGHLFELYQPIRQREPTS